MSIYVVDIQPGSPADICRQIQIGDELLEVCGIVRFDCILKLIIKNAIYEVGIKTDILDALNQKYVYHV